jgi:hypothetical protein
MSTALLAGLLSLLTAGLPEGCDDSLRDPPYTYRFDYTADIQPIWTQFCANCHVFHGGQPAYGLDLQAPNSYDALVLAPSSDDATRALVLPGRPDESVLLTRLRCNAPGPLPESARMPLERNPLSPALQARVYDWIAAGAPRDNRDSALYRDSFEGR